MMGECNCACMPQDVIPSAVVLRCIPVCFYYSLCFVQFSWILSLCWRLIQSLPCVVVFV